MKCVLICFTVQEFAVLEEMKTNNQSIDEFVFVLVNHSMGWLGTDQVPDVDEMRAALEEQL